jgi:enoyl-CoA hydratase/carnithine racemase
MDVSDYQQIAYDVDGQVLTIALDRPDKLNAFTGRMMYELLDALDRADADDDVRAIIVTGRGRAFCAGADLSGGASTFDASGAGGNDVGIEKTPSSDVPRDGGGLVTLRIFELTKPIIAAINGPAVGVGITMTLPMDVRLASDTARIGFVFARRGIVPEACSSWFLPRLVGPSRALEWVLTGRVFTAEEAREGGLVRSVHADALAAARELADEIVANTAPVSVALSRQMLWKMLGADHPMEAHKVDSRGIYSRGMSADVAEGVTSFLEKRPPQFPQRVSTDMPDFFPWWDERTFA